MNTKQSITVSRFLQNLGLTSDQTILFLTLSEHGQLTTLNLSRLSGIRRTTVYRLLIELTEKGVIEEIIDSHRKLYRAVNPDTLELLIKDQELKVKQLRETFPLLSSFLSGNKSAGQPGTNVLFFRGKEGVRQQVWNTLRTRGELLGYSYHPLSELIGDYYMKWYEEWIGRKLRMRDLYSDEYLRSKSKIRPVIDSLNIRTNFIISRYIPSGILDINHQMDIYNDVVSLYHWHQGEVFGVEIHNQKVASMQRQLFEIVWKLGK